MVDPADAGARTAQRSARKPHQIPIDQRRQIDSRPRARVVPEVEARIHLQEPQLPGRIALEVELRHAAQAEPTD